MAAIMLESGARMQLALFPTPGEEAKFNMVTTFFKEEDEVMFLVSMPMQQGKPLDIDDNQKLLIRYAMGNDFMVLAGFRDDVVKVGIRRYWRIRRVSEQRQFAKREDERIQVALRVEYCQPTWPVGANGKIAKDDGMTLDISLGGVAVYLNQRFEIGEVCELTLPRVGTMPEGQSISDIVCLVCWQRDAPKGSLYSRVCGLQFRTNPMEKERINAYVAAVKTTYKL